MPQRKPRRHPGTGLGTRYGRGPSPSVLVGPCVPHITARFPAHKVRKAKFGIASLQTTQDRRRPTNKRGGPVKGEKEEREDRPNAVTLIILRLPTGLRICQVAIIGYTRWPFLDRPSEPHPHRGCYELD